jgi:mRNA-degrading endonuclease RelE of RelBE toxin-antitoxin system
LAISSKGKGKSGGARIITQVRVTKFAVVLLSIYDKSEQGDISDQQIKLLLSQLPD